MPTALIVEDEPEANKLLSMLVRLRGYQSESAHSGAEAEAALRRHTPDVVFLDLMLPDTSGYEICRALKSRRETSLVPVVIVSARLADENRERCYQSGALHFVPKPYMPDEIFEALSAAEVWRHDNARPDASGSLGLGDGDESVARELVRLRSLLTAHTTLDEPEVLGVVDVLRSIADDAHEWGCRHQVGRVATAAFRLLPDRVVVTVHDESGWFAGGALSEATRLDPGLDRTFDEVNPDESGQATVLVKRFAPSGASPMPPL